MNAKDAEDVPVIQQMNENTVRNGSEKQWCNRSKSSVLNRRIIGSVLGIVSLAGIVLSLAFLGSATTPSSSLIDVANAPLESAITTTESSLSTANGNQSESTSPIDAIAKEDEATHAPHNAPEADPLPSRTSDPKGQSDLAESTQPVDPGPSRAESDEIAVSITIDSSAASSKGFPSVMFAKSLTLPQGATAYDALVSTGLPIGGSSSYVSSIGGLDEKTLGPSSGWIYLVDSKAPMVAANSLSLSNGDHIVWRYVI